MGTCPFTNSGGPGGKAGPCSTKSCAIYMKSQEICSFLAMGMAIWQTTFGPKADPTLGDHEPLWAAEKEIEDLQAALEAAKQINAAARIEELQAAMEEKKPDVTTSSVDYADNQADADEARARHGGK